jgi:hypothetical protein
MKLTRTRLIVAIVLLVLVALILLYIYYPRLSTYYFKINRLLDENNIKPIESTPEYLDMPLHNFYVNTSHNTYLDSMQHLTFASLDAYKFALKAGARFIEIDISTQYDNRGPLVCHGTDQYITNYPLPLNSVLDTIKNNAWHTSDPLFIIIEMFSVDNVTQNAMIVSMFKDAFGDKIVMPYDANKKTNVSFPSMSMRDLLNRVVIICRSYDPNLSTIMHDSPQFQNYGDDSLPKDGPPLSNMSRVYMHGCFYSALSSNMDSIDLRSKGYNCIAMNFQTRDSKLYDNLEFFKEQSFIPIKKEVP